MRRRAAVLLLPLLLAGRTLADAAGGAGPRHFVFFNLDRHRISETGFLGTGAIAGAQLNYTWRELEPQRDRYEFGRLQALPSGARPVPPGAAASSRLGLEPRRGTATRVAAALE